MRLLLDRLGFTNWFDGTLARPNRATNANAHRVRLSNDRSLRAFMSQYEFKLAQSIAMLAMCSQSSATDRKRHEYSGILCSRPSTEEHLKTTITSNMNIYLNVHDPHQRHYCGDRRLPHQDH